MTKRECTPKPDPDDVSRRNFLASTTATGLALTFGSLITGDAFARFDSQLAGSPTLKYLGPVHFDDLVVGVPVRLEAFGAEGSRITWSVEPNEFIAVSSDGILTPIAPTPISANGDPIPLNLKITLDDGRP